MYYVTIHRKGFSVVGHSPISAAAALRKMQDATEKGRDAKCKDEAGNEVTQDQLLKAIKKA